MLSWTLRFDLYFLIQNSIHFEQVTIGIKRCFQKRDEVKDVYEANTTLQSGDFPSRPSTTGKSHIITVTILRFMYLHVIQK